MQVHLTHVYYFQFRQCISYKQMEVKNLRLKEGDAGLRVGLVMSL